LLKLNKIVFNHYEILHTFQRGPSCGVFLARHQDFPNKRFTLKILELNEENVEDLTAARFRNEILTTYELQHPNIIRSLGYQREGDLLGLILEYLPFGSLRDIIESEQRVETGEILYLIDNVLKGLSTIHAAGIIHRDIRPENILFGRDGKIKISDFGDARVGATISSGQGITGKLDYLSPEYIKEGILTESSDIYSFGIGLYELITKTNPFRAESPIRALAKRLTETIVPPHELIEGFPEPLSRLIVKALATDTEERFKTAHEMLQFSNVVSQHLGVQQKKLVPEFPPEISGALPFDQLELLGESMSSLPSIDVTPTSEKKGKQKSAQPTTKSSFANKVFPSKGLSSKNFVGDFKNILLKKKPLVIALGVGIGVILSSMFAFSSAKQDQTEVALGGGAQGGEDSLQLSPVSTGWYVQYLKGTDAFYISSVAENLAASDYSIKVQTELDQDQVSYYILIGPYSDEFAAKATLTHIEMSEEAGPNLELKYFN